MSNKIIWDRVVDRLWKRLGDRVLARLFDRFYDPLKERIRYRKEEVMDYVD